MVLSTGGTVAHGSDISAEVDSCIVRTGSHSVHFNAGWNISLMDEGDCFTKSSSGIVTGRPLFAIRRTSFKEGTFVSRSPTHGNVHSFKRGIL